MNAKSNLPEAWFAKADADLQGVHPSFVALTPKSPLPERERDFDSGSPSPILGVGRRTREAGVGG